MKDKQGRAYATVAGTWIGDKLQADGDFTCIPANAIRTVRADPDGLFIRCSHDGKRHHLDGQIAGTGKRRYYLGLYPVKPK